MCSPIKENWNISIRGEMFAQIKRFILNAWLFTTLISLLTFTIALAAAGDLDTTFDNNGLVVNYVVPSNPGRDDRARGIAMQPNGKIVVAGWSHDLATGNSDFALTRYNANGSLDTSFSGDGRLITNFGGIDRAYDVVVQSNGKIIAAGLKCNNTSTHCSIALARYNPSGALDTTFSGDGKQLTRFGGGNNVSYGGLAIQSDGKIVVAGWIWNGTDNDFAIYRYNANGPLDTTFSFSKDGVAVGHFGLGRQDFATDLAIQSDGKIVLAGYTGDANYMNNNFAIARLNANGTADLTFSGDGRQTTNLGANDYVYGLALQPDGKIVAIGKKDTATRDYFAITRYNANGSLDTTFNGTGKKVFSIIAGYDSWAEDAIVQSNGKIVILGTTSSSITYVEENDFALVRLNAGGGLDTTFSGDGIAIISFVSHDEGGFDFGTALALQPLDGKYVLGGYIHNNSELAEFALARVLP
jgi:uncharacterized delta-60 repeat protein